jgi:uncharacterized protein (DUF58 family)
MPLSLFDEPFLRKLERLALLSRRATAGQMQGERRSSKRGQSVEFADFRPYVTGDDFRRIDWNAYARLERFFIKLFIEEEDLTIHFLIDTSQSMRWGLPEKLDYTVHAAGALGYVALTGLDRVTVRTLDSGITGTLPPLRGKKQALTLFDFLQSLSRLPANGNFPHSKGIAYQLSAYAANATLTGPLVLFSDLMDDGWMPGVNSLAGRGFEVTVLHILSPDEIHPTMNGDFKLVDSENASSVEITADYEMIEHYRQGLFEWQESWRHFCAARGIHYAPVETSLPLEELLFSWLRRQGVLR